MTVPAFDPEFAGPVQWAETYRRCGLQVIPAYSPDEAPKAWKRPKLSEWVPLQGELAPQEKWDRWYGPGGEHVNRRNMGIITGACSGNVWVLDLDIQKDPRALAWWRALLEVENNGMELETVRQVTGGGGRQLLFRAPPGIRMPTNKTAIGVDIRGQAGFAMMPPSKHESDREYAWIDGFAPWEIEIAMAPPWLIDAVFDLVEAHGGADAAQGERTADPATEVNEFGQIINSRESKMRDVVWHAVLELYRASEIRPHEAKWPELMEEAYLRYESLVGGRGSIADTATALEADGRGRTEFRRKWNREMRNWGSQKMKDAAARPNPKGENPLPAEGGSRPSSTGVNSGVISARAPLPWMDMSDWDLEPVPVRQWAIHDRVPLNQAGLFSGEGGTGKSIIELMKNVAHVCGKDWMGSLPEVGPAMYLGAEDEQSELWIRLAAIASHYKVTFRDLTKGGLRVLPLLGQDSMLCVPTRGGGIETTELYRRLYEEAGDIKPKNISIDTLSRAFGGNEIDRVQVYAFAMHMQALAKVAGGSVTILSHPSLTGISSGSGISGSTAWHGAFRFRQYLKGIKDDDEVGEQPSEDLRELEFKKNQYGPRGQTIVLRWRDGVFLPVNGTTTPEQALRAAAADGAFMTILRRFIRQGDTVSHKSGSSYYAPTILPKEPEAKAMGLRKGEVEQAMRRLMTAGRVTVEQYGKPSRLQSRLVLGSGQ